jgi:hypothetical protein
MRPGRPITDNEALRIWKWEEMELNDLFRKNGIDPEQMLVLRHRPTERQLSKVLPWLASDKPEVFNAYQQTQGEKVEKAMSTAKYVASFIGHEPGKALFIGLYSVGASKPLTRAEFWRIPAYIELKALGMKGFTEEEPRPHVLWFDLALQEDFYASWKGKLVVGWPPPERSWWRRAHRNKMDIVAILEDSALDADMPQWDEMALTWEELSVLPARWRSALSQWRGIYYIFDASDRSGYVGSAYGENNLCQRWENYPASGHGGNSLLKTREPRNFRFTILQRVSPDMSSEDVIRVECTWKERLHTRSPLGLNEN